MHQVNNAMTRRQMSLILGSLGAIAPAIAQPNKSATTIHQENDYKATPKRIYEILLDAKQFSAFTGAKAEIEPQPGGAFKLFDGHIQGRNVELIPNQRIVQAWRSGWAAGVYSIVRFELVARGAETRVVLDHTGFPEGEQESLTSGWNDHYWEPLRKYLRA